MGCRHTLTETISIYSASGTHDAQMLRFEIGGALFRLHNRIPGGAQLVALPRELGDEYKREIHLYRDVTGSAQVMEVAIRKTEEGGQTLYEYSTDYEL